MNPTELLFAMPPELPRTPTLADLRFTVGFAQGAAVAALRKCDDASGEENGSDTLNECFLKADDVQRDLLKYLYDWQARDEAGYDDCAEDWNHPEGPLDAGERVMMGVFQTANDRLNDLRMAIYALRARELAELQEAGVSPTITA